MSEETLTIITGFVESYSRWFYYSSVLWVLAGLAAVSTSAVLLRKGYKEQDPAFITGGLLSLAVGACMLLHGGPSLLEPEAMAIHQLLKDVSP